MSDTPNTFAQWAILELMGHVRLAGRVTEEAHFGTALGRIDIPVGDGFTTQYFGGGSVYRLTPTTEEIARSVAARNQPEPVYRWELPAPKVPEGVAMAAVGFHEDAELDGDEDGRGLESWGD
jgi:hypothetical protein